MLFRSQTTQVEEVETHASPKEEETTEDLKMEVGTVTEILIAEEIQEVDQEIDALLEETTILLEIPQEVVKLLLVITDVMTVEVLITGLTTDSRLYKYKAQTCAPEKLHKL